MVDTQQQKQAETLIARIDAEADAEILTIEAEARAQADKLTAEAHTQARRKIHGVIAEIRQTEARALLKERARIDTLRRQKRQNMQVAVVSKGLPLLKSALENRWETHRLEWLESVLKTAVSRLTSGDWMVEHPADWAEADKQLVRETITKHTGHPPEFTADKILKSGIRIWANGACLDGSIAALLLSEHEISAALLGALENGRKA